MFGFWLYIRHFRWRCSSFWRHVQRGADGPSFSSNGWATAWQWEDASSSLSILFCFSFYSICCCTSPSLFAAVHGRTFSPHGSTQTSTDANTLWLGFKLTSCCCTLFLTLDSIWLLLDIWKCSCDMVLQRTNVCTDFYILLSDDVHLFLSLVLIQCLMEMEI